MSGASETLAGTLAGVSTASAIGGPSGLPALSPAEKTAAPIPWVATGSLCRECHGYATPFGERPWRTLRGVFLNSRCQRRTVGARPSESR
jgi:hypothetical protein